MNVPVRMGERERGELGDYARRTGERKAAAALDVAPQTLARAIAGMAVMRSTANQLRSRLAELSVIEADDSRTI